MIERWLISERAGSASLPSERRYLSRKGLLHAIDSFFLATLLLVLTACVDLLHTCTSHWLFTLDPLSPTVNGSGCYTDLRQAQTSSRCHACLFLHALSATKAAILAFALSWLIFIQTILPHWRPPFTINGASPWLIRAPPCDAMIGAAV